MAELWSLRGLSWPELAKRTCRKSWDDEVFGQAARLSFYYFLAMFPALLLLLILLDTFAGTGSELRGTLLDSFRQILSHEASALMATTISELNARPVVGIGALSAGLSAIWAALNGTWAMMTGLNRAYEVEEARPWWKVWTIAFGLTIVLGVMGFMALVAILYGNRGGDLIGWLGLSAHFEFLGRIIRWLVIVVLLLFSCALLYRFGPNLKDRRWQWSSPGAVVAVTLWVISTLVLRVYQDHLTSSQRIYAGLNAVVTLLFWLYLTGAALFIGGEANSAIEKAATEAGRSDVRAPGKQSSGGEEKPNQ
jgi:membrane protein